MPYILLNTLLFHLFIYLLAKYPFSETLGPHILWLGQDFLTLSLLVSFGLGNSLLWETPIDCRVLSSILSLHLPDGSSTTELLLSNNTSRYWQNILRWGSLEIGPYQTVMILDHGCTFKSPGKDLKKKNTQTHPRSVE